MRSFVLCGLALIVSGCGNAPTQAPATESSGQVSERILARAESFEREHKTKEAFAAYHQLARNYAETAAGKKAVARIAQAQKEAIRRSATRKKK